MQSSRTVVFIAAVVFTSAELKDIWIVVQVWRCYCRSRFASALAVDMTDDPLDAMKARWSYIQGFLFPWMREDNDPITEALGRLVTTLDVIGLEAFVPEPPRGPGRPPEDRRALARAFVAKAMLGVPTTNALIERLAVDKSLRRILGWERRSQVPSEATFSRAFAEFAQGDLLGKYTPPSSSARSAAAWCRCGWRSPCGLVRRRSACQCRRRAALYRWR